MNALAQKIQSWAPLEKGSGSELKDCKLLCNWLKYSVDVFTVPIINTDYKRTIRYNYLAQKLCFWTGIIFIRVYVSVCLCVSVSLYLDYLKKFLTDFDET